MAPLHGVLLSLGLLSPPSISAQPDPDISWGQPVTLVCRGPAGTNTFRLEKQNNMYSCADPTHEQCKYTDLTCPSLVLVYIIPTAALAFLLLILLLLLLLHQCWKRDLVKVDGALMLGRNRASPTPAAGGPQEVTYAQLDHRTLTQRPQGFISPPSISAQPGPDIPWGQPVTLVCRGPAGTNTFRLEKQYNKYNCENPTHEQWNYTDLTCETEAQFLIPTVNERSVGFYRCLYHREGLWSNRSDPLELVVRTEDVSDRTPGPSLDLAYVIPTAALAFLLLILLLLLLLHQCWKRDLATVDGALMLDRNSASPTADPTTKDCTYATLAPL
ncbi:killer cell immunoglobulin-like receptor 3DL2 [Sorex fumeus]|uniref:killer cell immunoglobulin-like receptor 3DL2 n=1 Tax=Sorex fumeus TaxID=62283 RepID=UPI0024AC997F|nr:killer cell immunoglobulin-like receptor 3DL2 [Sorex fumeus]